MVLNPKMLKRYEYEIIRNSKTDVKDNLLLMEEMYKYAAVKLRKVSKKYLDKKEISHIIKLAKAINSV